MSDILLKKKIEDMYKVKRFSQQRLFGDKAMMPAAVAGLGIGALAGNELHAQYDYFKAKHDYDPEAEAAEEDRSAEEYESKAKSLRSDKNYMKRYEKARKDKDEVYNRFDKGEAEEWELDEAENKFDEEVPEGDVDTYEYRAESSRSKAKDIRENPEKYREEAGVNARFSRRHDPGGIGIKAGAVVGAIGGGLLGSKI